MAVKTKKVRQKSTGKVLTVYSSDGGKTWSKTNPTKTSKIKKYYTGNTGNTKSNGTTAKERLDAKQKALDEARKPTVKSSENNKKTLKKKTTKKNGSSSSSSEIESDANYAKENADFNDATSGARKKRLTKEKATADKAAKDKENKEWLKRTRNSPAARAGIGDKQRLAARERHQKFKADRAQAKADRKAGVKKKRKLKITTWRDLE